MLDYEITEETCALVAINDLSTKIIELDNEIILNTSTLKILDYSCKYYGSSYIGRKDGSINILKNIYKIPIIVEESKNIIFFPINSPRYHNSTWISVKNIKSYRKIEENTEITFKSGKKMIAKISYSSLQKQILRASYLEMISLSRKSF